MSGTVNISRKIWKSPEFKKQAFTEREAFMWLVMEASWKPRDVRPINDVIHTDRGQLAVSIRYLAEAWGWPKSTVDRFLKRLEKRDVIGTANGTGINLLTICKYDEFQNSPNGSGTDKSTKPGQQRDSSGTKVNKDSIPDVIQSVKKDTNVSQKNTRRVRIAEAAVISDSQIKAAAKRGHSLQEAEAQFKRFKNDALAKGKVFVSWDRAFVTWLDSEYFRPIINGGYNGYGNHTGQGGKRPDPALEQISRLTGLTETPGYGGN